MGDIDHHKRIDVSGRHLIANPLYLSQPSAVWYLLTMGQGIDIRDGMKGKRTVLKFLEF